MDTAGSILLISGIAGLITFQALLTFRPRLFSRGAIVGMLALFFVLSGVGLVILTATTGGQSLHTGG